MDISIKTSLRSYLIYLLVFSPVLIIGPVILVYLGKYIDSNFWPMHIISVALVLIFFMYIKQTVHIEKECITLRKPSFSGTKTTKVYFNEVTSWSSVRVVRLFIGSNEVMQINWAMFSYSDQKLLINFLLNSGIKQV